MKFNKILFPLVVSLISLSFYGQEEIKIEFKSMLSLSVFSPTISYAPRYNMGYVKKIHEKYWVGVDFGYGDTKTSVNFAEQGGWIDANYKLYEIHSEIYYDLRPKSKLKHLVSAELFFVNHKDKFNNS
jgi:hypothetical protein